MVDICKCNGFGCTKKETCFRYLSTPDEYQSYASYDTDNCDSYWEVKSKEGLESLNKMWK